MNYKEKHKKLSIEIEQHNYNYHSLDKPTISDYQFDQLFNELLELESKHPELVTETSPSQRAGSTPLDKFSKVKHRTPMLSLQNSYSPDDILAFDERIKKFLNSDEDVEFICEPKLDGLALELVYEKGLLTKAITRGDGTTGEDVTLNTKTIKTIPLKIDAGAVPDVFELRGEVLLHKSDFESLNEGQLSQGLETFSNPRNAAAGTLRQLDSRVAATRPLRFYAYAPGVIDGHGADSHYQFLEAVNQLKIPNLIAKKIKKSAIIKKCKNAEEAVAHYHFIESVRDQLEFEIDGMVMKVNSFQLQQELGFVARSPRWATAAKYKPKQETTVIKDIVLQVGRTGALTPVAIMEPVFVGGVTITNATLHNESEIARKDVRIGDTVVVQRAGDVIPEVVEVVLKKRKKSSVAYEFPQKCPVCGTKAEKNEDEAVYRCPNLFCPAVVKESLKHFVSKKAMNIDKLGEQITKQLWTEGLVKTFSDIYTLKKEDILPLERQGEKSANNIIKSIDASRQPELSRFIYALGIRFVGEQTAKTLANYYQDVPSFLKATEEDLLALNDIGPKVASSITSSLSNKDFVKEVQNLLKNGVKIAKSDVTNASKKLKGLKFVITGSFDNYKRSDLKKTIEVNGGSSPGSVSKNTDYLIAGEAAGSKLKKAEDLGVKVLSIEQFLAMLD